MSFGQNLKLARKQKNITQEQLAELLGISRQAVSKWESGNGYPEIDKLRIISKELNVSLDYLMDREPAAQEEKEDEKNVIYIPAEQIAIYNQDRSQVVRCLSVRYSKILLPAKNEPPYILQGVDHVGFFGAHTIILGWYDDEESVKKELSEISASLEKGIHIYQLKYCALVEFSKVFGRTRKRTK